MTASLTAGAFVYPWDVVGDPDAPRRLAATGVTRVTLASAYHATRALTPRHPDHRVVTARHAAVYYPPDAGHWAGSPLRPHPQTWLPGEDPFAEAARALADAGLEVHSWVILAHNSRLGREHPEATVRNAYGDRYPWAPCIARPEVRSYVVRLAAEAATRPGTSGTELESCGWYGLDHLHAHDKIGGAGLGPVGGWLMSLCFCASCHAGYRAHGVEPEELRRAVTAALAPYFAGTAGPAPADRDGERAEFDRLLGAELAGAVTAFRDATADTLQREAVAAVRAAALGPAFRVLLHADPAPHRYGANVGVAPAAILDHADGVVLPCPGGPGGAAGRSAVLAPFVPHRRAHTALAANFGIVAGMGGSPATLRSDAAHAAELGATELRLYHGGLATDEDLAAVTAALASLG
ncbi:hypothetical protein ACTWP5_23230 [Streptomyces sp. 4N509B]|uniref:hypothetical protein n=1 Tax=Streptomyces sp. 4N509B TaxID=3457413 RepID=UPI003FD255F5